MNKYFVVATAKYPIILRGKHYKIGDSIPSELTDKEYEFYKHALNVESMKELNSEDKASFVDNQCKTSNYEETLKKQLDEALKKIAELENKLDDFKTKKEKSDNDSLNNIDASIKPKRPYAKKEKDKE